RVASRVPGQQRGEVDGAADVLVVGAVLRVGAEAHRYSGGEELWPLARHRRPLGEFQGGGRVLGNRGSRVGDGGDVVDVEAGDVVEERVRVERLDRGAVLDGTFTVRGELELDLVLTGGLVLHRQGPGLLGQS